MTTDSAQKLVLGGAVVNVIASVFPAVGTIAQFQRFESLLVLGGYDPLFSRILVVALFGMYAVIGMITPVVVVREVRAGDRFLVAVILLVAGAMTFLSLGGVLLILAAVLLIKGGSGEASRSVQSPEADAAEALRDQVSRPRRATTCPLCGATLAEDDTICAACHRRSSIRG